MPVGSALCCALGAAGSCSALQSMLSSQGRISSKKSTPSLVTGGAYDVSSVFIPKTSEICKLRKELFQEEELLVLNNPPVEAQS